MMFDFKDILSKKYNTNKGYLFNWAFNIVLDLV